MYRTTRPCPAILSQVFALLFGIGAALAQQAGEDAEDRPADVPSETSAQGQDAMASADGSRTQSESAPGVAERLKTFDLLDTDPRAIAEMLATVIRENDYRCSWVSDFQIVRIYVDLRSFKAKCPGEPLYGIRVADDGTSWVMGGEYMVAGLGPGDGEIISFSFAPDDTPLPVPSIEEMTDKPQVGEDRSRPSPVLTERPGRVRSGMRAPSWLMTSLVINGIAAGILAVFAIMTFRRGSQRNAEIAQRFARLTSAGKDAIVDESKRVGPRIYRHPDGIYIARGQRGRRRFFSRRLGAVLYRDFGARVFEIT